MSPWDIIGWAIILAIVVPTALVAVAASRQSLVVIWRHLRTYRTPPAPGQVWMQHGRELRVDAIYPNGRIGIKTGGTFASASWSDSPDEWARRARQWSFYLQGVRP